MNHPPLVGIVGGFGPCTSADFCVRLVNHGLAMQSDRAPSFVMDSVPLDMAVAARSINGDPEATRELVRAASASIQRLAAMGVRSVAVPCNTLHAYAEEFAVPCGVEFLHIADALLHRLKSIGAKCVGFLGSSMTVRSGFYFPLFKGAGIDVLLPTERDQTDLSAAIAAYVATGDVHEETLVDVRRILGEFVAHGADTIALGCTDIAGILVRGNVQLPLPHADSTDALAEVCARKGFSVLSGVSA